MKNNVRIIFTDSKTLKKSIIFFLQMATVGHFGFGPVQRIKFRNFTQINLKALFINKMKITKRGVCKANPDPKVSPIVYARR